MTRIILTRHGHVDWIAPERFRGRAELPLSDLGKRQAEAVAGRIAETWRPEVIYTSPLSRCRDTGAAIARATGAPAQALEGLADTDYGQWQGLTHDEVRARWPDEHRLWLESPEMAAIPDGESLADVLSRGTKMLGEILRRHAGKTLVLVGHDSINRILLLQALGLPLARYWRLKQEPCCLNEMVVENTTFTLHRINETYHLAAVATTA